MSIECHDIVSVDGEIGKVVTTYLAGNVGVRMKDGREVNTFGKSVTLVRRENRLMGLLRCLIGLHKMRYGLGCNVSGRCQRCGHRDKGDWS